MGIRLEVGCTYTTQNGTRVHVLSVVQTDHIGINKKLPGGVSVFVSVPFYRCQLLDTGEIVFYSQYGNMLSEKHSPNDKPYQIVRLAGV